LAIVRARSIPLGTETIRAVDALGRILAQRVTATERMPPFPASTVDGYAVRAGNGTVWRRLLPDVLAGSSLGLTIRDGEAARIMTGAPLPIGADAVVMFEDTAERDGSVQPVRVVTPGDNIRPPGIDLENGQTVLEAGVRIGAAEIGLLATVGAARVAVARRPRVAILSTGDELVEPDETPRPGSIRDSNRYALMAAATEAGAEAVSMGMARDDERLQRERIEAAFDIADVVITSGGVSVGTRDLIKPILEALGTVHFGRIALRPGKPLTFASVGSKLAFGLPGNPVSALVTFEVFVRPALLRLQGHAQPERGRVIVEVEHALPRTPDRTEYQRAIVRWASDRLVARTTGSQISSRLISMVGANALLEITPGTDRVVAGSRVPALMLSDIVS
jgi:molybdopterin molybdotransferase